MSMSARVWAALAATALLSMFEMSGTTPAWAINKEAGCADCHVSHDAQTATPLAPAVSSTLETSSAVRGLRGASALCMSCHDGTGVSRAHSFGETAEAGMGSLCTTHPIGVIYEDARAADPTRFVAVPTVLDSQGMVGCPSCHVVH